MILIQNQTLRKIYLYLFWLDLILVKENKTLLKPSLTTCYDAHLLSKDNSLRIKGKQKIIKFVEF
jgi:hypothetical protein